MFLKCIYSHSDFSNKIYISIQLRNYSGHSSPWHIHKGWAARFLFRKPIIYFQKQIFRDHAILPILEYSLVLNSNIIKSKCFCDCLQSLELLNQYQGNMGFRTPYYRKQWKCQCSNRSLLMKSWRVMTSKLLWLLWAKKILMTGNLSKLPPDGLQSKLWNDALSF